MKALLYIPASLLLLVSCDLLDSISHDKEKDNPCQIVSSELVPQVVKDSLAAHYPGITAVQWLNKDNAGYCANFKDSNTNDIVALFSNSGNFLSQEESINVDQTGQHTDSGPDESGCHCEIENPGKN